MKTPTRLLLILAFIAAPYLALAQASTTFPEGLKKLSMQEMMALQQQKLPELPVYNVEGQLLTDAKKNEVMNSMQFIPEYYKNASGDIVAIRLRKITAQEAAMFEQFAEQQRKLAALVGTDAKDFETVDMEGNTVKLSELKGSVVAINFWYIGCKPCIMEMPELNEIVHHFKDENVKFVAIALDKKSSLTKFEQKRTFDYDIVPDGKPLARLYEITGYPTHCIVDQEGKIAYFKSAYSPQTASELTNTISRLLNK